MRRCRVSSRLALETYSAYSLCSPDRSLAKELPALRLEPNAALSSRGMTIGFDRSALMTRLLFAMAMASLT
jgi:hypothetical protein